MISRYYLKNNPGVLEDKVRGAICGLAIGDSLGDASRAEKNQRNYGFTTDFNMGVSWSTDDTEFALMVAQTIINANGEFTEADVERMWLENVVAEDELRRGGYSEMDACANLKRGLHAPYTGKFNPYNHSDGAAMRTGPIGIFCAGQPNRAKRLSKVDATISHDLDGIRGAQAVAAAVSLAMVDADMDMILAAVLETAPEDSWFRYKLERAFTIVEEANFSVCDAWMKLHDELCCTDRAAVPEAIPAAFSCLKLENRSFRDAMVLAANYSRDADTIGAVAGIVMGAKFGAAAIPSRWIEKTRYPSGTCLKFTKGKDLFVIAQQLTQVIMRDAHDDDC